MQYKLLKNKEKYDVSENKALTIWRLACAPVMGPQRSVSGTFAKSLGQTKHQTLKRAMEPIFITRSQLEEIKQLQLRKRPDWPATFSVNCQGRIWPFANWGHTPEHNRDAIAGISPTVDAIAVRFLDIRPEGGRFFVDATRSLLC